MSSSWCRLLTLASALICALVAPHPSVAQSTWARRFGGSAGGEFIHAMGEMPNGEIVVAASTDSFGTMTGDGWLIHLDARGQVISEHVVGQPLPGGVDGAVVLPDGGAVFASRSVVDLFVEHRAFVTRVAADGTPAWVVRFAAGNGRFFLNDIIAVSDGSFLGVGQASETDAGPLEGWLVRFSSTGSVIWQQQLGGGGPAVFGMSFDSGVETADGGFVVTGWATGGAGAADLFVMKTTVDGAISWTQRIGGADDDSGNAIVELAGGGYAIAGSTNSFTASGHAGWVVRLDAAGALTWAEVIGDAEWSDLQSLTQADDGNLVVLGRVSLATNDLWAAKIDADTGSLLWQRAYAGDSGDYAGEIAELVSGDLLLAGTWGWGFPEEDLWLLRTDAKGEMPGCPLVVDTSFASSRPRVTISAPVPPVDVTLGVPSLDSVVTDTSSLTVTTQCEAVGCDPLACDALLVDPEPACEGTSQTFTLVTDGGSGPVAITWDLDGDTIAETPGNPVSSILSAGVTRVTAFASDGCAPIPQECQASRDVVISPSAPPGEVSDVIAGALPLLVLDEGARISFEERLDAVAYNIYADAIGSWYAPSIPAGSECFIATTAVGGGRLEASPSLAANSWLVVTASSPCAEGSAGTDSFATDRMSVGIWTPCGGPGP